MKSGKDGNKKERSAKKSLVIAAIIFGLSGLAGASFAFFEHSLGRRNLEPAEYLPVLFNAAAPVIVVIIAIVAIGMTVVTLFWRRRMKQMYLAVQENEDESVIDHMEKLFSRATVLWSTNQAFMLIFMAILTYIQQIGKTEDVIRLLSNKTLWIAEGIVLIGFVVGLFAYRSMLETEKKINPEKRGELFDIAFNRQWEASCDEAQKRILYESGYRGHVVTMNLTAILEVIAIITMSIFRTGILPCLYLGAVLLAGQVVSSVAQYRLERKGWRERE